MIKLKKFLKETLELELSDHQSRQFQKFADFLLEFNKHTNLTRIPAEEIELLHFYDSLLAIKAVDFKNARTLIDIGTGAGFPGVPLKIIYPHLKVVLVDARQKKVSFLNQLAEKLELKNISAVHARAEDLAKDGKFRGKFDLITARAVSEVKDLVRLLSPFKNSKGEIILYKGPKAEAELKDAQTALKKKNLKAKSHSFTLPESGQSRFIISLS